MWVPGPSQTLIWSLWGRGSGRTSLQNKVHGLWVTLIRDLSSGFHIVDCRGEVAGCTSSRENVSFHCDHIRDSPALVGVRSRMLEISEVWRWRVPWLQSVCTFLTWCLPLRSESISLLIECVIYRKAELFLSPYPLSFLSLFSSLPSPSSLLSLPSPLLGVRGWPHRAVGMQGVLHCHGGGVHTPEDLEVVN